MRHSMGRVWFVIALIMIALGVFSVLYGFVVGTTETLAPGLGLVVGGALLAVGFRRGARRATRR
jgi:hypothetical protein